jgi:hypothetical protein
MPSLFEQRFQSRAVPMLNRTFGVSVTYIRGVLVSDEFTARRGNFEHRAIGAEYGIEIGITMRDFILPVASLVLDGNTITPRTGDRIQEGSDIFEIQPIDQNKQSVEPIAGGYEYLVHTKKVE